MQGLGRPIISVEQNGYRVMFVGKEVRWSKKWKTFHDFLFDFIKIKLGVDWGNAELKKPEAEQHPLIQWYRIVCEFQRAQTPSANGIYSGQMNGAARAYLGLAYDLYLCAHNAELPDLLLKRLRNPATFEGALYEAFVIGRLAKAGFKIELEDETDSTRSHCELTATHSQTGRKFSVEAKAITTNSSHSGSSATEPRVRDKLYNALRKQADHDRIVFIELNRAEPVEPGKMPSWVAQVDKELEQAERELTIDKQPAPPSYVFISNRAFMHDLTAPSPRDAVLACGFKIPDFASRIPRSLLQIAQSREKHQEMYSLKKVFENDGIPSTFDERLPEEVFDGETNPRLLIGNTYAVPQTDGKEVPGVLVEAAVMEPEKLIYGFYRLADGTQIMCTTPISDTELAIYKRSPETFFGVVKHIGATLNEPMDYYDFLYEAYSKTSREKLIEFVSNWPNFEFLSTLDQKQLAQHYCVAMAESMWNDRLRHEKPQAPAA